MRIAEWFVKWCNRCERDTVRKRYLNGVVQCVGCIREEELMGELDPNYTGADL